MSTLSVDSGYSQSAVFLTPAPITAGEQNTVEGEQKIDSDVSEDAIQPSEVIRFKINFNIKESTNMNEPSSGEIDIHDPTIIPSIRSKSINIQPGKYYEIYIQEQVSQLLEAPYRSKCINYKDQNLWQYRNDKWPHPTTQAPLSHEDCMVGCLGKSTYLKCRCWPPEVPFVRVSNDVEYAARGAQLCDWRDGQNKSTDVALARFTKCFANFESECNNKCHLDCELVNCFFPVL